MSSKRLLAMVILLVMMTSTILFQPSSLASDGAGDASVDTQNVSDRENPAASGEINHDNVTAAAGEDIATEIPQEEPATQSTDALTNATEATSEPQETTVVPKVTDNAAANVFSTGASYAVQVNGSSDAADVKLVARLEVSDANNKWSAVENPDQSSGDYTIELTLDASGSGSGSFSLAGLSTDDNYRARIISATLPDARSDWGSDFTYTDSQIDETNWKTVIQYALAAPSQTGEADTSAVFSNADYYSVTIRASILPETGLEPIQVALYSSADNGKAAIAQLTISPDDTGAGSDRFALEGLPSDATYTALALSYGDEALTFAYDETVGKTTATLGDLVFIQNRSNLGLDITIEPAPATDDTLSLFGAFDLLRSASTLTTLTAYDTAYQFVLNLSLNGGGEIAMPATFIVTEHPETGNYSVTMDSYDASLESATASINGTTVTLVLKPMTGGESLTFTLTMDVASLNYSLAASGDSFATSITGGASGVFTEGEASASASASEQTDYTFTVLWNDNKAADRPTPNFILSANGTALSTQPTPTKTVVSYNEDSYTYSDLPKYDSGTLMNYSISQQELSNYQTSVSGSTIQNTRTQTMSVHLQWNDASTKAETRPSAGDAGFMDHFTLKRKAQRTAAVTEVLSFPSYSLSTSGDLWTFSIPNLASFDQDGFPYEYMMVQTDFSLTDNPNGTYVTSAKNVGVYNGQTAMNTAFNGGTLINTITDKIGFTFHNEWVDNDEVNPRPDVKYYLYRYPTNSSQNYLTLAPVTGHDNMMLADKSTSVDIAYAANGTLPRYDLLGNEYIYYIRVIMPNSGDYQIRISNPDDDQTDFLLPGGTVTYIREATTNASYTVSWIAKAVQTMKGGVTVQLLSRLSADTGSTWAAVEGAQQTLTGFRTETMTLTSSFAALPKYDSLGARILYRVEETGATIDSSVGVPMDNIASDSTFTSGEHSFLVTQPAVGDSSNTIYNTIIGTTKLTMRKIWNEPLADEVTGAINVRVLRNGSSGWASDAIGLPDGAEALGSNVFGLSGNGNFEKVFSNLPRYDSEGREYSYTVQETSVNAPAGYSLSDIVYSYDAGNDPVATIYNTNQSGGSHLVFRVNKIWLDDGDLLQRVPVTFWLYYLNDDGTTYSRVDGVSLTLSAADSWTGLLHFSPSGEYVNSYDRYLVREVTNDDLTLAQNGTQAYLLSGASEAQTLTQKFVVSTEKTGDHTYDITNRRIGKVQITIAKEWAFQAFASDHPIATFGLYADGVLIDATQTLLMTDPSATIVYGAETGLEKFNAQGEMIHYTVRELGVTDSLGNTLNLKTDETIVSSITPGTYTLSSDLSKPDTMAYTFHNSLGGNGSLRVNIIWRDTITDVSIRPDIRLQLYRTTDSGTDAPEYVTTVRLWDTDHEENSWYWTCDFGSYPAFDAAGNRYYYYTKAVALQSSRYSVSYFSDTDGVDSGINPAGTDTESTFNLGASEAFDTTRAYLNFDETRTGVVVLTLSDTQDIVRYKIWRNLPNWFLQSSLPTTYFKLYRTLTPLEELNETSIVEAVQKDGANWIVALTNNASTAEFNGLPVYNKFGSRYYYYVEEVNATGSLFNVDWYTVSDNKVEGTVTNTYVTGSEEAPVVSVRIDKTWDYSGSTLAIDQTNYPATTYDLHQYWEEMDGIHATNLVHDSIVATATIASGAISGLTGGTISTTITTDSGGKTLPMYTPDGQKFVYYVVERSITGYTTSYTDALNARSAVVFAEGETEGTAAITNTYQPNVLTTKTAIKVWDDQNDLYSTRPLIASADSAIQYTLWQKVQGGGAAVNMGYTGVWTQDAGNPNQWICTFSGEFPTYTTLGQSYQYFVTESLSGSYAVNYALSAGTGTLKLTNKLNQVNVQLSKSWRAAPEAGETTGALLDQAELEDLAEIGAMPDSVIFSVLQIKDGATVSSHEVEVSWNTLLYNALKGKRYVLLSGLPQYFADAASTADAYVYEIQETAMVYHGVEKTVTTAGFSMTSALAEGSNTITEITNQIETQKLYFVKDWVDDNNRDGVRPSSIVLTVTSVESGVSASVTLSPSTTSSDPSADASRVATGTGNRWRAEMTVPLASLSAGYTVTENNTALAALGYTPSSGDPATQSDLGGDVNWWGFTNTRAIKTIAIKASKVWAGEYTWSSLTRPASVSLQLQYRSKGSTTWTNLNSAIALPQDGQTWANADATWENLPAYAAKTAYSDTTTLREYRVVEAAITGYTTSYSKSFIDGSVAAMPTVQTMSVTNTLKTVSVSGKKTWVDVGDRYDTRPGNITLSLLADGSVLSDTLTPTWVKTVGANDWTYQYSNLPRYLAGSSTPIVYSVVETPVSPDYTPTTATTVTGTVNATTGVVTAANFTNTLSTVSVSGTKTWQDDSDSYRMRPNEITLTLLADGVALEGAPDPLFTKTGNTWSYVFADLPRFVPGTATPIVYSVEEATVPGYNTVTGSVAFGTVNETTRNVTGANFTNALITIDLSGTKTWVDEGNRYLTRPGMEEMQLTLYENGVSMSVSSRQPTFAWSATSEDAVWQFHATGLPKYQKGTNTLATYTIAETPIPGYAASSTEPISGTSDKDGNLSGFDWTNTLQIISISGTKQWNDQENRFQTRPDNVTLTIYADGLAIDPQPEIDWTKTGDAWTYTINRLPRYQTGSVNAIVYSIRETPSPDYVLTDGDPVYGSVDSLGNITEADFVNELITVSVSGTKHWEDQANRYASRPDDVTLTLLADGSVLSDTLTPTWVKTVGANDWTYQYSNLPRYLAGSSTPIVYSVVETPVSPDYTPTTATTVTGTVNATTGVVTAANFTNTLSTVSVSGTKTWQDDSDSYRMRPNEITLTLLADGVVLEGAPDPAITKTGNTWSYVFSNLPRFVPGTATPIVYSVEEATVAGYENMTGSVAFGTINETTRNVTGANFTNALITIDLSGTKTWVDEGNRYLTRPGMEEMQLTLYENGVSMSVSSRQPTFAWSATGEDAVWQFHATGLPKYQKGTNTLATYTIAETPIPGYAASSTEPISGTSDKDGNLSGFDWTNTLQIISISGTKQWNDQENRFQTRPDNVTLTIYADGLAIDPQPEIDWTKTGDAWTYTINRLPRYQTGSVNAIVYSIRETPSPDYVLSDGDPVYGSVDSLGNITEADFVNELITVSVSGTKYWEDQANRYASRPDDITLTLLADGAILTAAPLPVWDKLSDVDAWTYSFDQLPRYRAGTAAPVVYSVRETQADGYAATEDQVGVVDTTTGNITQANFTNRLLYELEIDNGTINAATGYSDAGGYVAVSGTTNAKRDIDPYKDQAVSASWEAENFWEEAATFRVSYLPHGADEKTGWETITVSGGDLTALKSVPYFANAMLKSEDGVTTLTLADDYQDMPYRARVIVTFVPTLKVRNTTDKHIGGTVEIEKPNAIFDGRFVALVTYGTAEKGYAIDLSKLALIVPVNDDGSSPGGVVGLNTLIRSAHAAGSSTSVRIRPNSTGRFSTTLNLNIGGANRDVTFAGKVTVLSLDKNQNPTKISITLDSLPAPIDIGIPFIRSDSIPATGDPILGIAAVFVVSGFMLVLIGRKRRKEQANRDKTEEESR